MKTSRRSLLKKAAAAPAAAAVGSAGAMAPQPPYVAWNRRVPVRYEADIAVLGGGIAGVSAACAAARSGASVILVERFAITGGVLTTGGVANFCGDPDGVGEVFDAILRTLREFKAIHRRKPEDPNSPESVFHYEILAIILQEMLLQRKVKLLLHTRLADVNVSKGVITECLVAGKSGLEAIRARQFIDCTGDGDVARLAGFATHKGRVKDGLQLPMSLMYFVRHVEERDAAVQLPAGWFQPVRAKDELPMVSIWPDGPRSNAIKLKIPMFDSTSTEGLTAAEIRARRRMLEILHYFQAVEKRPWLLDHCSPIIVIREGCRIVGDYILKVDDLRAGRVFDDGVARGTFYLDAHTVDEEKRTYLLPTDQLKVPPYQIPLRSLIARDGKNLLMAGRCFSADQLALSSARVSTSGSMMGQAAGIAAALSVKKKCQPRECDPAEVKKIVLERGANLACGEPPKRFWP
ncbi:MAG: FAD-dependent oxidoreductase [Bryobacterales bacterium]|nr:FAD-dependent oxidoreductase [Bryobacterales bacterium]